MSPSKTPPKVLNYQPLKYLWSRQRVQSLHYSHWSGQLFIFNLVSILFRWQTHKWHYCFKRDILRTFKAKIISIRIFDIRLCLFESFLSISYTYNTVLFVCFTSEVNIFNSGKKTLIFNYTVYSMFIYLFRLYSSCIFPQSQRPLNRSDFGCSEQHFNAPPRWRHRRSPSGARAQVCAAVHQSCGAAEGNADKTWTTSSTSELYEGHSCPPARESDWRVVLVSATSQTFTLWFLNTAATTIINVLLMYRLKFLFIFLLGMINIFFLNNPIFKRV